MSQGAPPPRPRKAVLDMPAYRPPLEGRRGLLRLDFNERTEGAPRVALEALARVSAEDLASYPEYGPYGERLARALGVAAGEVLPTNATDEAIQVVVQTFVDPGERMLIAVPTFAMFLVYARIAGVEVVEVPYEGPRLEFPLEAYLARLASDPRIRLAVLVDPNNPTATDLPPGAIERICRARPDVPVLVDEAYGAFTGRTAVPLIRALPNLIVSQTFSKAHGLAGLRIGHLVSCAASIAALAKVRSPYSVNVAAMAAASAVLESERLDRERRALHDPLTDGDPVEVESEPRSYVGRAADGMRLLLQGLEARGLPVVRAGANFALARAGGEHASLVRALRSRGILVRDRSSDPLLDGCVRFTAGPPEHVRRLLDALSDTFATRALLLDMDGTLVDVSRSYIACCAATATALLRDAGLPSEVTLADVLALKAEGRGMNDDWACTRELVLRRARAAGCDLDLPIERVIEPFQALYLGSLAATERWLPALPLLVRLARRFRLGVVTGRPRAEVDLAFALDGGAAARPLFGAIVAREDVHPRLKPDPAGIDRALGALGCGRDGSLYAGDSTDDVLAARAAGVRAIGLLAPGDPDPARTREALLEAGAERVLEGVAALEALLL